jgi:hypothetical protein
MWVDDSSSRCASATSASGSRAWMTGRTAAVSTRGQTCSRTAATMVAFSSAGRARSDVAMIARALAQQQPQVELRSRAPLQPDHHEPPVCRERLDVAREVLRTHVVQDDVRSRTAPAWTSPTVNECRCPDRGNEVLVPVVDEHLGAEGTAYLQFFGRPRR